MKKATIPASTNLWPVSPTHKQSAALALCGIKDLFYGGAAGGGKSEYHLMAASQFANHAESRALILRKTYRDLTRPGALLDRAKEWWEHRPDVTYRPSEMRFTFDSGATIEFGHLKDSTAHFAYDGGEYTYIGIDEARQIPQNQIDFLRIRLRAKKNCPVPLQFRLTSNPGGLSHNYLKHRYVDTANTINRVFIPAGLKDNPHLNEEQYREQFEALTPVERAQMLEGDWSIVASTDFFEMEKIKWVDEVPDKPWKWVRSWDYAATRARPGTDPDWTVGALMGFHEGQIVLAHIERFRENPAETIERVVQIAQRDGKKVDIVGEEEGGSSGKSVTSYTSRELAGWSYTGMRPSGDKAARARGLSSSIRNGNFYCVSGGPWVQSFVDELRAFPTPDMHDDQVDSMSQAETYLTDKPPAPTLHVGLEME